MAAKKTFTFQGPLKIVSLYVLVGFLWILFSDQLLAMLVSDRDVFHKIGTYKGWGYVLVTGALLYVLIKRHSDRLTEGENWLRTAYDAANIGTWQYDVPTGIVRFDERARGHYGFDSLEVPYADMMARIHPEDVSRLEQEIARTIDPSTAGRYSIEFRVIHADGSVHWLGVEARIRYAGSRGKRRPILEVGTSRDIAEDKRAELQVRYFSRLYATLSQVNQTIVRSKDRQELFESICKVAVEFGEFHLAWIGLLDPETGVLNPLAEYGFQKNKLPFGEINAWEMPY
ncbi:MAG: PAS domain-containing protein, partial [Chloroflexi bacterium]|nr:PAS domain-containing protein [Chloroflexota bacterium]